MVNKLIFIDGQKSVDLWEGDEGWKILTGEGGDTPARDYYKFIPTMYRAVQLRANSVASMPFKLTRGTTDYDLSSDWENKVGFMPNPGYILQMVEAALVMTGSAYLFRERSVAGTKQLRYHLPGSITPIIDPVRGLEGFMRPVNGVDRKFKVDDYVYFWLPDPYVELGPAINFPAQAAFNAGGVLMNIDVFAAGFFQRGAIKAMLLTVQGMPKEAERAKLSDWWRSVVGGVKNAFGAQVVNADAITPVVIGEGIKELENVTVGEEKREDVAIAMGIPMSILFANAANYATSQQDELNFITKTVIPDCELIAGVMNEQLFEPLGLHMTFMPETLDAMQEDEAARSAALGQLTGAGVPLLMAMDLLGFELTDEQRAELEKAVIEKEQRAEEMAARLAQKPEPEEETETEDENTPVSPQEGQGDEESEKRYSDMDRWQRKAQNALRRGKAAAVPFDSEHIPADEHKRISLELLSAVTAEDVKHIFGGNGYLDAAMRPDAKSVAELTEALKSVALAMREKDDYSN